MRDRLQFLELFKQVENTRTLSESKIIKPDAQLDAAYMRDWSLMVKSLADTFAI